MAVTLNTPILEFPNVGEVRAKRLEKLGLHQASDVLEHYPRHYEDRRQIYRIQEAPLEGKVCVQATAIEHPQYSKVRQGLEMVQVRVSDGSSVLHLTFFNQPYIQRSISSGVSYIFYGAVEAQGTRRSMVNPLFEQVGHQQQTGCIMPIYPLTAGITNYLVSTLAREALSCAGELPETLPASVREAHGLMGMEEAVSNIHFPADENAMHSARRRLTFEELFYLSVGLRRLKDRRGEAGNGRTIPEQPWEAFRIRLPFEPTGAQRRVMAEIAQDLGSGRPMNRLVQGDVGSGKTVVAAYAAWLVIKSGFQAALMAPTEILAEQHAKLLQDLLGPAGVRVGLLTGSLTAAEKKKRRNALESGKIDLAVGTHALISDTVRFRNLALIVADEQHRFGVAQRAALAAKGGEATPPHVLVMSATPIPRTLALIVYGDLDVSVVDELPPGRTPVKTYVIREDKRERMYGFVRTQVSAGHQVYIICPAVEENPDAPQGEGEFPIARAGMDLKAVKTYAQNLQEKIFPDLKVGLVHGKLKPKEKDAAMQAFVSGETQVLVSTTVVEVGVDVPNATLMIIEDADRFGLSQLHQLRGRVGRGKAASSCVLMTSTRSYDAMVRLRTLADNTDGFKISEEDLKARGPGDFFGSRQHGMPEMKLADLAGDMRVLQEAQQAAEALLNADPTLAQPENKPVLKQVQKMFSEAPDVFN